MSSGDDDYGNPQRKIDDQQILLNMRDERIALLRTKLQAAQERERWMTNALGAIERTRTDFKIEADANMEAIRAIARACLAALNDTKEPSPTTTEPRP